MDLKTLEMNEDGEVDVGPEYLFVFVCICLYVGVNGKVLILSCVISSVGLAPVWSWSRLTGLDQFSS